MFLYHYASEKFKSLETRLHRGEVTEEEKKIDKVSELGLQYLPYYRHISFFMEPVPLALVASVFNGEHPFWKPGGAVYEHIVKVEDCFPCVYKIVESEEITKHYYDPSNKLEGSGWIDFVNGELLKLGYLGDDIRKFKQAVEKHKGAVARNYAALPTRPNFNDLKAKYAATVPHVMLYPRSGSVDIVSVKKQVIPVAKTSIYYKW